MKTPCPRWWRIVVTMAVVLGGAWSASAQTEKAAPADKQVPAAKPAAVAKEPAAPGAAAVGGAKGAILLRPTPQGPPAKMAPGVMISVDPQIQPEDAVSRPDIVELLATDQGYDFARQIPIRRDVWWLEFKFKPVRMIYVDIPQPSGQMQRKQIWYLMYSVTNRGKALHPVQRPDGAYDVQQVDLPVPFAPSFLLESVSCNKWYPDRVIPLAMAAIQLREDPSGQLQADRKSSLLNTVDMVRETRFGETFWGVATWEDVDPKTTRFAIYVTGLTNAYQWIDDPGRFKKGDRLGTGRHLLRKTLKLNFRRTGDEFDVKESQIRYGLPDGVDYQWVYR